MNKRSVLNAVFTIAVASFFVFGCATKKDTISQAEKNEKNRPASPKPKPSPRKDLSTACPS